MCDNQCLNCLYRYNDTSCLIDRKADIETIQTRIDIYNSAIQNIVEHLYMTYIHNDTSIKWERVLKHNIIQRDRLLDHLESRVAENKYPLGYNPYQE